MKERIYRALVIGAGNQGASSDLPGSANQHKIISYGHALKEHPGFKIVGFVDRVWDKADQACDAWGGSPVHDMFELIDDHNIEVAIIATGDDQHYRILKELSFYPLKLVICEKPICTELDQAREIVELYRAKGVPLMVNYTRRFLPYYRDLKHKYEAGEFGSFMGGLFAFNRGFLHSGSHMVDFIRWFFSGCMFPVKEIKADHRIWLMDLFFEKYHWREERIGDQPVWPYYDQAMYHVIDNAYNFLEGSEPLYCTGEDALQTLEVCFRLMEGAR